jgi:NADH-quinone oxidoreductase subunit J
VTAAFYVSAAIAVLSTVMAITRADAVHALLYLVVSLLAAASIFYVLGAPFAAVLEVIIYAGAIMVLFVFVVMMLNLGQAATIQERSWIKPRMWIGPAALTAVLMAEVAYVLWASRKGNFAGANVIEAEQVGIAFFGPYLLAVELASMLLLAGLVAACHLGRGDERK